MMLNSPKNFVCSAARLAFTLIELLIVLVIISITISISLRGISSARDQAKSVVCQSHLYALGLHQHMYSIEEKMPFYTVGLFDQGFTTLQNKYNIPFEVFDCPGSSYRPASPATLLIDYQTYRCDWKFFKDNTDRPMEFPTLWDRLIIYQALNVETPPTIIYNTILSNTHVPGSPNHKNKAANLLFLDGHIENVKPYR